MDLITFDFDGNLSDFYEGHINPYKESIQNLAVKLIAEGYRVKIVTRRHDELNAHKGAVNEHIPVYEMASKLGIDRSDVHFTNREWKYKLLNELGANYHLDDDEQDIFNIRFYGKCTHGFLTSNTESAEKFYNLLKK